MFQRFKHLQWKLTLSYTVVTTAVLLLSNSTIGLFTYYQLERNLVFHEELARDLAPQLELLPTLLKDSSPEVLDSWLKQVWRNGFFTSSSDTVSLGFPFERLSLVSEAGELLALQEADFAADYASYAESESFKARLANIRAYDLKWDKENSIWVAVLPTGSASQRVFLVAEFAYIKLGFFGWFAEFLQSLWNWLALSLVIGSLFGYLASRGLVKRLSQLGEGAKSWAQGDFTKQISDTSGDEITELATNLNRMALQLEGLVQTKEQLGALEERGRLARELHDTIKQQVFSAQMQLASLQLAHPQKPELVTEISASLLELNKQMQLDLTSIIHALRPALLEDVGLLEALKSYTADWQARTKTPLSLTGTPAEALSLDAQFALYRVVGEALSNIEKHSQAKNVTLHLQQQEDDFVVTIYDDGQGFNPQEKQAGYGLSSMKERLASLNGTLELSSSAQGTCVKASVPLELKEEQHV